MMQVLLLSVLVGFVLGAKLEERPRNTRQIFGTNNYNNNNNAGGAVGGLGGTFGGSLGGSSFGGNSGVGSFGGSSFGGSSFGGGNGLQSSLGAGGYLPPQQEACQPQTVYQTQTQYSTVVIPSTVYNRQTQFLTQPS